MQCPGDQFNMEVALGVTDTPLQLIPRSTTFDVVWHYGAAAVSQEPLSFAIVAVEALDRRSIIQRGVMGANVLNLQSEGVSQKHAVKVR
jgi:hypothetical protein